jgi:fumarate reductase subunit D
MDRRTRDGIELLARGGFAAKGIVYLIFGYLGIQAAFGAGDAGSTQEALLEVLQAPFGRLLLAVLAIGLIWYAIWRFLEAFADANDKGNEPKGLARRTGYFASGAVYSALAFDAVALVLRWESDGGQVRSILAPLLNGWLAVVAGIIVLGYGCYQIWKGFEGKLGKQLKEGEARREAGPWVILLSRIGLAGRGILFAAMGYWLMTHPASGPSMASDSTAGGGLQLLARMPQGQLVMACGAAALMAYGVFQLVHARYRRINVPT